MFKFERMKIPSSPGVYLYKDRFGKIIYIGKAKNLRSRVSSYFSSSHKYSPKTRVLVANIWDVEFFVVSSEVESLILENKLIKKYKPKYNILLKDSKTYPYIKLTCERVPKLALTRRVSDKGELFGPFVDAQTRNEIFNLTVRLFGLVTSRTYSTKSHLNFDIGLAPARSLEEIDVDLYLRRVEEARQFLKGRGIPALKKRLRREMDLASSEMNFELALERRKQIEAIEFLLEKQSVDLVKSYDQDVIGLVRDSMNFKVVLVLLSVSKGVISAKKEFKFDLDCVEDVFESFVKMFYSQAYVPREVLVSEKFWGSEAERTVLEEYLCGVAGRRVVLSCPKRGEKKRLVKLAVENARLNVGKRNVLVEVKKRLGLRNLPRVIEVFDMSNLSYDFLVGGMTRWVDEKPDKGGFRRFDVKSFSGKNDDFRAMEEVVFRRYARLLEEGKQLPDLVIIDGGLGQFEVARRVLKDLGILYNVNAKPVDSNSDRDEPMVNGDRKKQVFPDLISIAKGAERKKNEIYTLKSKEPLVFDDSEKFMLFLRKVRDSVHNFVIAFNRKKRDLKLKEEFK